MEVKRFTNEEVDRANNTNILDYVNQLNLGVKEVGKTLKVHGYGGLYIDPVKNRWNCFSQNKGGGPIQLVMFLEDKSWVESVKQLISFDSVSSSYSKIDNHEKAMDYNDIFILPEKNNTFKHMIAYLIKTRGIDKSIVYNCIQNKTLYEDKNRNCVFVGYDSNNNPRYANIRSTNTNNSFKGDVKGSDKAFSFCIKGTSNIVYVFESPIEVLSYLTLLRQSNIDNFNHHLISLGGVSNRALAQYLKDNPAIRKIALCLNNDNAGIEATKNIGQGYKEKYNIINKYPKNKDFNEDLLSVKNNELFSRKSTLTRSSSEEKFNLEL